jgi:tetratricopeptide (TPR) repeat protein
MIYFRKQERVKGAYYFRKSWKYFERALTLIEKHRQEKIPVDTEILGLVNFGSGLFHFVMSLIPPSLQLLVSLVGFTADRTHSLKELQACIDSGCSRAVEASIILAVLKKYFTDEEEGGNQIIIRLQNLYPKSIIICYLSGFTARIGGDLDQSITYFEKVSSMARDKMKSSQLFTTSLYHLGYCNFVKNNWEQAAKHYEIFLKEDVNSTGKRFRPYTAYQLGFCYWKLGRKVEITPLYTKAKEWVRTEQSYDKFALRKMEYFLTENQYSTFDEVVIATGALNEGRLFKDALKLVETLIPLLKEPINKTNRDYFALYYFQKAESLKGLKKYDRSKQMYERAIAEDGNLKTESYVVPYSWVGLAEIAIEEKKWDLSDQYFAKSKTYHNYDWAQLLSYRIYGSMQKLARRRKVEETTQVDPST